MALLTTSRCRAPARACCCCTASPETFDLGPLRRRGKAFDGFTAIRSTNRPRRHRFTADPGATRCRTLSPTSSILDHVGMEKSRCSATRWAGAALHLAWRRRSDSGPSSFESASPGILNEEARLRRTRRRPLADSIGTDGIRGVRRPLAGAGAVRIAAQPAGRGSGAAATASSGAITGRAGEQPAGMGAGRQDYLLPRLHELKAPRLLAGAGRALRCADRRHVRKEIRRCAHRPGRRPRGARRNQTFGDFASFLLPHKGRIDG